MNAPKSLITRFIGDSNNPAPEKIIAKAQQEIGRAIRRGEEASANRISIEAPEIPRKIAVNI
tara:strand:+ start:644 stop:829 length:186 start_codon:yes stop_codon:yes gene_type:complete